jgi:hypothetical protein
MVSLVKPRYVVVLVMSDGTERLLPERGAYKRREKAEDVMEIVFRNTVRADTERVRAVLREGLPASAAKTSGIERMEIRAVV